MTFIAESCADKSSELSSGSEMIFFKIFLYIFWYIFWSFGSFAFSLLIMKSKIVTRERSEVGRVVYIAAFYIV